MIFIKKSLIFVLFSFLFFSCAKKESLIDIHEIQVRKNAKLIYDYLIRERNLKKSAYDNFINSISLEEKIAQLFVVNLEGNSDFKPVEDFSNINNSSKKLIPGGYLFFNYNLSDSPKQIMEFTKSINDFCVNNDCLVPFLSIDHEGGVVNRLKKINSNLPSCKDIAEKLNYQKAFSLYDYQAKQLSLLGFNLNFAPVTEFITDKNIDFLGSRSFGTSENVIDYSILCIKAYKKNKVASVIKHFPGNSNTDPHIGLPVINVSNEELEQMFYPFEKILETSPSGVLMSHAIVDSIDKGVPSCLSKKCVSEILKNKYNFNGIVFSDDIFMGALSKNGYPEDKAVVLAIESGIDCIMVSEKKISSSVKILYKKSIEDENFRKRIEESFKKMIDFKLQVGIFEYQKNDDESYSIVNSMWKNTIEDRLLKFNKIKAENDEFNKINF